MTTEASSRQDSPETQELVDALQRLLRERPGEQAAPAPPRQPPPAPRPTPRSSRRRRGRGARAAAAGAAAVVVGAAGLWWVAGTGSGSSEAVAGGSAATAEVVKEDLVQTQEVDGTLGFGDETEVVAGQEGVVTWIPREGTTVGRGDSLYRLDDLPVVLLYGDVAPYRTLEVGAADGRDVKQLEENLAALGYTGFTVDEEYTDATATAVEAWQADLGLEQTGRVEPGQVEVAGGPVRVSDHKAAAGARSSPGKPVVGYTAPSQIVTVDLEVSDQQLAQTGAAVTVELPGGETVNGTVTGVGTVAQVPSGGEEAGGQEGSEEPATVEVTVALEDPSKAGSLDQAPVDVQLVSETREGVLTVPVSALLALGEGAYGVEVVEGDTTRTVPVEVGMFASGKVEVTGEGITAGTLVGVPPS